MFEHEFKKIHIVNFPQNVCYQPISVISIFYTVAYRCDTYVKNMPKIKNFFEIFKMA